MRSIKPQDQLAAQLEKIIRDANQVLREYYAATGKKTRRKRVVLHDPRTKKPVKIKR